MSDLWIISVVMYKPIELCPRSLAKLKSAFTRILLLARILVREQGLDLHDVPEFFNLDFKVGREKMYRCLRQVLNPWD